MTKTLFDKLWDEHTVKNYPNGTDLIYIDKQLLHEVTSPQAFEGLELQGRNLWRLDANIAVPDHNVPTTKNRINLATITDKDSKLQIETLNSNCKKFNVKLIELDDKRQGIVHVIGPELGLTLPGMTIVCGDSHTSTHGALGAISMGIGTSEVEQVLATQCLILKKPKNMLIKISNKLKPGVTAKDLILYIIGKISTSGGTGYAIEYAGEAVEALSMEARMTMCNMSIEAGARCGLVAVDDTTIEYCRNREFGPKGDLFTKAEQHWRTLHSEKDANFDKVIELDANDIKPQVTWGTAPDLVVAIDGTVPKATDESDPTKSKSIENALQYMGLNGGEKITDIKPSHIFIGSCTNSRIEDLRAAAAIVKDKKIASSIKEALVVPGSGLVKEQAEAEGLDKIFTAAGFEWRESGCSMCLGMNPDKLAPQDRCASTSNRNFEGRQGMQSRTHLVSPAMAAACALAGHFVDVTKMEA